MVPFFDYRPEFERYRAEFDAAYRRVLESGQLILGPEVSAFESEFAAACGVPHTIAVNSGTDALILALRALELPIGGEILVVGNAGVPMVSAIRAVGLIPRWVEVVPATCLMDPCDLARSHSERCVGIMPVHLYGQVAAMESILEFAAQNGLPVIEDCAQAHGATRRGRHAGSFGAFGCFSFYPTKNIGAFGDGGAVVTSSDALAHTVRLQRMYGFDQDKTAHVEGLNTRMDELQAAFLRVKLKAYPEALRGRRAIAKRYDEALANHRLRPVSVDPEGESAYHLYPVRSSQRDHDRERLEALGIQTGIHYPESVPSMPAYRNQAFAHNPPSGAERACAEVFSLPLFNYMSEREVDLVIQALDRISDS